LLEYLCCKIKDLTSHKGKDDSLGECQLSNLDPEEPQYQPMKDDDESLGSTNNCQMTTIEEVSADGESVPCYDLNISND